MPKETETKKVISVYLTAEQKKEIDKRAKEAGHSITHYVRRKALGLD